MFKFQNEILINDDLDTYHQSPILNSDTNKVQTKRLPDNEFSKVIPCMFFDILSNKINTHALVIM